MTDSVFNFEVNEQQIAIVTIDVPGEKMNTLRASFVDELNEVVQQAVDANVKGLVFISGKSDNFIAGADIKMLEAAEDHAAALYLSQTCHTSFFELEKLPFPTVAAIHGAALGGGLEFAMKSDEMLLNVMLDYTFD